MYRCIKRFNFIFVAVLTLSLAACGKDSHNQSSDHKGKLDVKTTVYPLKSFAQQIGGKYVNVESVYPKGVDPHTYDPSQKQMVDIGKSDLFLYTGDNLDPVAKKIAKAINDKDKTLSLESALDKNKDLLKAKNMSMSTEKVTNMAKHMKMNTNMNIITMENTTHTFGWIL